MKELSLTFEGCFQFGSDKEHVFENKLAELAADSGSNQPAIPVRL